MKKLWQLIKTYDKVAHFLIGVCCGIVGVDRDLFVGVITAKEVADCYKDGATGFGVEDWLSGYGGYMLGIYLNKII